MMTLSLILIVVAVLCALAALLKVTSRVDWVALGVLLLGVAMLLGRGVLT